MSLQADLAAYQVYDDQSNVAYKAVFSPLNTLLIRLGLPTINSTSECSIG